MKIFTSICFNTTISQYYINTRNTDSWYMKRTDLISNFEIMAKLKNSFSCRSNEMEVQTLFVRFISIMKDSLGLDKGWETLT